MAGEGPERYRRAIELAAALGQVEREVASIALDQLRREPADALSDAVVAFWLDVPESAVRSLKALAAEIPVLDGAPIEALRARLGETTAAATPIDTTHVVDLLAVLGPAHAPAPLPTVEGFEVDSLIGRGGMGSVYRARQPELRREVALKVLRPPDPRAAERFLREARAAASVQHPHVVTCYGAGRAGELLYIALELVPGGDGEALLRAHGRLPERRALAIARDACRGLVAIEAAGLVHRDLKPANLLLDGEGRAKIADLGLARFYAGDDRVTRTGAIVGTPVYMAPEQAGIARNVDVRADIYALGATLFHLVTGEPPFSGHLMAILSAKAAGTVPDPAAARPGLAPATCALIRRAMAHAPEDRHPSARALLADLEAALEARAESVRSRSSRIRAAARRARWHERFATPRAAAAGAGALVAAIALALAARGPWRRAPVEAPAPIMEAAASATSTTSAGAADASGASGASASEAGDPGGASDANGASGAATTTPPDLARVVHAHALVPPQPLAASAAAALTAAGHKVHRDGGWYTIVTESPAWSAASFFGERAMAAPVRADFHVLPQVARDATAPQRAEQGFEANGGFFFELGARSEPHEIASAAELHGFAVWVTLVCDRAGKAHGLVRVVSRDKPADDRALRIAGDAPTPGVAIVDRFEVPQVSRWGPTEVWLRIDRGQLAVAIARRDRTIYELVRAWADIPLAVGDEPAGPLYLWAQMGNWGDGRGHGSLHIAVPPE